MRPQKVTYCWPACPPNPYSSRSDSRIISIASGLVLLNEVSEPMVASTGSIGVRCVMKKVTLMPMKTTRTELGEALQANSDCS